MRLVQRRSAAMATVLVVGIALSACGRGDESTSSNTRYVALGDSSVAGAGIGPTEPPCYNSTRNYASQLAKSLNITTFVDASCISATTQDVLGPQKTDDGQLIPPQIEAVTADTDLVTVGIGFNDNFFAASLFGGCYSLQNTAAACRVAVNPPAAQLALTEQNIVKVLAAIKKKAPRASIILVGYLRIMPDSGSCNPTVVRILPSDLAKAAAAEGQMEEIQRSAAKQAKVGYINIRRLSIGHDACSGSSDAWTSGAIAQPGDGTFLHPRAKGADAVAQALLPMAKSGLAAALR